MCKEKWRKAAEDSSKTCSVEVPRPSELAQERAGKDLVWGKELLESSCFITSSLHLVLSEYKLHVIQFLLVFVFQFTTW